MQRFGGGTSRSDAMSTYSIIYAFSRMIEYHDAGRWYPKTFFLSRFDLELDLERGKKGRGRNHLFDQVNQPKDFFPLPQKSERQTFRFVSPLIGFKVAKILFLASDQRLGDLRNIYFKILPKVLNKANRNATQLKIIPSRMALLVYLQSIKSGERVDLQTNRCKISNFSI